MPRDDAIQLLNTTGLGDRSMTHPYYEGYPVPDPTRYWDAQVPSEVDHALVHAYGSGWRAYAAWVYLHANPDHLTFAQTIVALANGFSSSPDTSQDSSH